MVIKLKNTETDTWYVDYANFLVTKIVPRHLTYYLRKKILNDVRKYIWDDPYLFKSCPDGIIRRCVFGRELHEILEHCHKGRTGGHYGADIIARKIFKYGFYWPTIFKDAAKYVQGCDACQQAGNISLRNEMPLTNILVSEVFDICGIDFIRPFPSSRKNKYILVAVDYVSKWVEAEALPTNDAHVVVKFLKKLFSRFGVPKALISDRGTHFCNSLLEKTLKKYGVTHRLATPYHPQTSGQTKNTNRVIKRTLEEQILERTVYGKAFQLPIELKHKAYWALKKVNLDLDAAGKHRFCQYNQLDEFWTDAYEHSLAYKERTKRWHDSKIMDKEFQEGEEVLVFNSRLKLFPGKLRTRWYGPYTGIKSLREDGDNLKDLCQISNLKAMLKEFLATVKVKTVNGEVQLQALVDGKKIIITESIVRRDLQLEDTKGVDCLLIMHRSFETNLPLMGVGKGFSSRVTPLFLTMVVHNQEEMGEGSAMPTDPHRTPTIIQPSTSQPQKTQKPRRLKRKETEVPQASGPTTNVVDEDINEKMDDSLVMAATTASSLEAEQDSGNIDKTQSKETPNEPSSPGTS
ncbi:reverse transcriptase domain-containing protein [Tanacetum coccineum]